MPEIFEKIIDQTKKLNVENITKKEGFPLDISALVHDMAATHGEQVVIKVLKDWMQMVRSNTLKEMKSQDQAKEKAELEKS
jgi:hypothetical protein